MTVTTRYVKDIDMTPAITDIKNQGGYVIAVSPSKMVKQARKNDFTVTEYMIVYRT